MISNEYSKLKKIIVGREYNFHFLNKIHSKHTAETNKEFEKFYERDNFDHKRYDIDKNVSLKERNDDLDNLSNVLTSHGIEVIRPDDDLDKHKLIDGYELGSNIRDIMFTIGEYIIITRSPLTMRSFEYTAYSDFLSNEMNDKIIIQTPLLDINKSNYDTKNYKLTDDLSVFKDYKDYFPVFDAANLIKHDGELIMNICNKNEYAGYKYLSKMLPYKITPVFIDHHHIDGALNIINDNLALVCYDSSLISKERFIEKLPKNIQKMELIHIDKYPGSYTSAKNRVIASIGGMFINLISIDPTTVISNEKAFYVNDELEKHGIKVIKIKFKDASLFGGGIHCTTLDVERE